jgi:predicted nucleotidyltransferase
MDYQQAVDLIRADVPDLVAVYAFGSRARGTSRGDSDLDLAVLAPNRLAAELRWNVQEQLARSLRVDVDLIDLRSVPTVTQKEIVATGTVIFGLDASARRAFEGLVLSTYARLNEERREILERVLAEGRVHG